MKSIFAKISSNFWSELTGAEVIFRAQNKSFIIIAGVAVLSRSGPFGSSKFEIQIIQNVTLCHANIQCYYH